MKVSDLGEFGLIERLHELLGARALPDASGSLIAGIGDDAAVWRSDAGVTIATTDTLVEGVHFIAGTTPWRDVGWKALAVNVSDVAAMGGAPDYALVTLCLPEGTQAEDMDELYTGLVEAGEAYSVTVAGGDIVASPSFAVTVALHGRATLDASGQPAIMRRGAARPGDLLAVSGTLGGAAGGLRLLREERVDEAGPAAALLLRHLRPQARLATGLAACNAGVRCAIDVSDGLLQDLHHVCRASGAGAVVWRDKLPVDPDLTAVFGPEEALACAAGGGEDYELLLAGDREAIDAAGRSSDGPVTVIGEIVIDPEGQSKLLDEIGEEVDVPNQGWDHLRGDG